MCKKNNQPIHVKEYCDHLKCERTEEIEYNNNHRLCFGIVKEGLKKKPKDVIRVCIESPRQSFVEEHTLHVVEALDIAQGLTRSVSYFMEEKNLDNCTKCRGG